MSAYQNNLKHFTRQKLTVVQFDELWTRIVSEWKISNAMRARDFSARGEIPYMRKMIYLSLVASYVPQVSMNDLFPEIHPN